MNHLKKDFPFFLSHPEIVYCDNAATTQKPNVVIDRINQFYTQQNAPVHRGIYRLAEQATQAYEDVRTQVQHFIGAAHRSEIIFTPNATAGINLIAQAWAKNVVKKGDEIVLTELEHHANLVPWLSLAKEVGAIVRYIPVLHNGYLDYTNLATIITHKTKIVAATALSNVTGTEVDIPLLTERAHAVGAVMVVDACQAVGRRIFNAHEQKIDFLVFSGHKILGPGGVGVLFAERKFHAQMTPLFGGGGAVSTVGYDDVAWRDIPERYEAGTPAVADVLGLGAALSYLEKHGIGKECKEYEAGLCRQLIDGLHAMPRIKILGPVEQLKKTGHLVSFAVEGIHAYDVAAYLDKKNICVRAGHHCAQPLHSKFGIVATVRVSFALYNTPADVERILVALRELTTQ